MYARRSITWFAAPSSEASIMQPWLREHCDFRALQLPDSMCLRSLATTSGT